MEQAVELQEGPVTPPTDAQAAQAMEGMSTSDAETYLAKLEKGEATKSTGEAKPTETKTAEAEVKSNPEQTEKKSVTLDDVLARIEALQKETGRIRSLNSSLDKLPQTVQKLVREAQAEQQRQAQLQNLSPEERQAIQENESSEKALEKFVAQKAIEAITKQFGGHISALEKLREEENDKQYWSTVADLAGDDAAVLEPHLQEFWKNVAKEIDSPDPEVSDKALARYERATKEPSYLVWEAAKAQRKKISTDAAKFTQSKDAAAQAAAESPKGGAKPITGKKSVTEMRQEELDSMDIKELEAAIPEMAR